MGKFFLLYFVLAILSNPLLALIIIFIIFLLVDRRYMRWFPRFMHRLKNEQRLRQLLKEVEANPHNVTEKLEIGRLYADRKRFNRAIPYLEGALGRIHRHAEGLFYLGWCYLRTGRVEAGKAYIEEALELNPRLRYGDPYLRLAEFDMEREDYKQALNSLERADEAGLSNAELEYKKGQIQQKLGHKEKASQAYERVIQLYRTSPKYIKKEERRWALLARFALLFMRRNTE